MGRNLGGMGESQLEHWAHECDMTCNRVQNDKGGWDVFLQIPRKGSAATVGDPLLDIVPGEIACLIQVKATDTSTGKVKGIKLSNWDRLVKIPLPAFYVVLEYEGNSEVQNAYLVHVDEYWIYRTLKRLRQLAPNQLEQLHKRTMSLSYSPKDEFDANGKGLESEILAMVGENPLQYFEMKKNWISKVGFDEYRFKGSIKLPPLPREEFFNTLVDFSIGVTKELQLDSLNVEEIRFGIPQRLDPKEKPQTAKMQMNSIPPTGKADMTVTGEDGAVFFRDSCGFYAPATVFPFIPFEFWKTKFTSAMFSLIVSHRDKKIRFSIAPFQTKRPQSLSKMARAAKLIREFTSSVSGTYKISFTSDKGEFAVKAHSWEFPALDPMFREAMQAVEDSWMLAKEFDVQDLINVSIDQLLGQRYMQITMNRFLKKEDDFGVSAYIESKNGLNLESLVFLVCGVLVLGNIALVMIASIEGPGEIVEEAQAIRVGIERGRGKCLKKFPIETRELRSFDFEKELTAAKSTFSGVGEAPKSFIIVKDGFSPHEPTISNS